MTGKERAAFRAAANSLNAIQQIGHGGISDEFIKNTDAALTARELIKMKVLGNLPGFGKRSGRTTCFNA